MFTQSPKLRAMVVSGEVPVAFLRGVVRHRCASVVLRRMLAEYEAAPLEDVCELLEHFLLAEFAEEEHSHAVIVQHALMRDLVLWARSGGARGGARTGARALGGRSKGDAADVEGACAGASRAADGGSSCSRSPRDVQRLRRAGALKHHDMTCRGERLFEMAFVPHDGLLPRPSDNASAADSGFVSDPSCPWDSGALDLLLLRRAPASEDSLQLVRRVLIRSMRLRGLEEDTREMALLWPLGRWPFCRDPALIGEAFRLLSDAWRRLAALPGLGDLAGPRPAHAGRDQGSRRVAEELLIKLFADLEVWRLPPKALLTPWVPGQVLVSHVASHCAKLEERQFALMEETRHNLEEITRLQAVVAGLASRLEVTNARSQQCMQRQTDVNETLRRLR
mmetsp:Transcript_105694/g.340730  ORF Transcript_105694/g.340730 Transcript_105694/m.340730 type:complete len:393 (+) Transcript_105694:182-1360(+)